MLPAAIREVKPSMPKKLLIAVLTKLYRELTKSRERA